MARDPDLPIEEAFEREWKRRIAEIEKLDRHRNVDAVILGKRAVKTAVGEVRGVLYHGNSTFDDELNWDLLLKTDESLVWFRSKGMQEFQSYLFEILVDLVRAYRKAPEPQTGHTYPWYHLKSGVLSLPFAGEEEAKLRLTNHPLFTELTIEVATTHAAEMEKSLRDSLSWGKRLGYFFGFGVRMHPVRNRYRNLAGLKGEEVVFRSEAKDEETTYTFNWRYRGENGSMSRPEIDIEMEAKAGDLPRKLALWDEMLDSFHYLGPPEATPVPLEKPRGEEDKTERETASGLTILKVGQSYGLRDRQGKELLAPQYQYIGEFQDGMLLVMQGKGDGRKLGLLDRHGKTLTPVKYDRIGFFRDGVAVAEVERTRPSPLGGGTISYRGATLINLAGKELTGEFKSIGPFRNGLAQVELATGDLGFINRSGKLITKRGYAWLQEFKEGRAVVRVDRDEGGGLGVIDETGREIVAPRYYGITDFHEGVAVVESEQRKHGYLNRDGVQITPMKYDFAAPMLDGVAVVTKRGRHGLIDHSGRELTPIVFDYAEDRNGVPLLFSKDYRWGAVDLRGRTVIPFQYRQLHRLGGKLIRAIRDDDAYGVLDGEGRIVVPFRYSDIMPFADHLWMVTTLPGVGKGARVGVLADDGGTVIQPQFDQVEALGENLIKVVRQGKQGAFDHHGRIVVPPRYDQVSELASGLVRVKLRSGFGLIDHAGPEVVPVQYDEAMTPFGGKQVRVAKQGKFGFYDSGTLVVPFRYDYLYRFEDGRFACRLGEQWGLLDRAGRETGVKGYEAVRRSAANPW